MNEQCVTSRRRQYDSDSDSGSDPEDDDEREYDHGTQKQAQWHSNGKHSSSRHKHLTSKDTASSPNQSHVAGGFDAVLKPDENFVDEDWDEE